MQSSYPPTAGHVPSIGVVILAAGRGVRFGGTLPKQFQLLGGKPVFAHSLHRFDRLQTVRKMVLVLPESGEQPDISPWMEGMRLSVTQVAGGRRRQDSSANGLEALMDDPTWECDVLMIHDAARPFVDLDAVHRLARATMDEGSGLLASRCSDTVKIDDGRGMVSQTLDRDKIWLAQTPQAIRKDIVSRAIAGFRDTSTGMTDEAALLEHMGTPVKLVESSWMNFKITSTEDLATAELILAGRL